MKRLAVLSVPLVALILSSELVATFISRCRRPDRCDVVMTDIRAILFAEDNANDVELTLEALGKHRLVNEVVVAGDGAEAINYPYRRNQHQHRSGGNPALRLLESEDAHS